MEKLFDFAATPEKQISALKRKVFGGEKLDEEALKEEPTTKQKSSSCSHHHNHGHHDHDHSGLSMFAHDHSFEILKEDSEGLKLKDRIIWSMLFVAGSSIFAKEILYRLMRKAGEKAGSASTIANAYHHRADAMSAALGLLGVVSSAYGLELLDALAGLGVSAVILQLGGRTLKGSILQFFDYQGGDLKDIRNCSRGDSDKGTAVNVFATRHGLQVVLHGTLMMRKDATCVDVAYLESMILEKVKKAHPNVLFDVFFKVRPLIVPVNHHHHHNHGSKSKVEEKLF
jgi:divalent metal cation (Fe/Co/Zn/Cd) transporter